MVGEAGRLMPGEWILENYGASGSGYEEKVRGFYSSEMRVDRNGDGELDWSGRVRNWDLRFRHRYSGALLTVVTAPMDQTFAELRADVLAGLLLERISASESRVALLEDGIAVSERTYAPRVISQGPMVVGGRDAWEVVYDRVDVERTRIDPGARPRREAFVVVRTGMPWVVSGGGLSPASLPTAMVFRTSALAADFAEARDALHGLLGRVRYFDAIWPQRREAVLACTQRPVVGFAARMGGVYVPGVTPEERGCIQQALSGAALEPGSYSYGHTPPEPAAPDVSEPAVAPAVTPNDPPPAESRPPATEPNPAPAVPETESPAEPSATEAPPGPAPR
ncbi:MAG: hypothetical protein CMN30_12675 [Sandaracinus sp.]|nr:hypothetical protein [Sandaracinus sp.]